MVLFAVISAAVITLAALLLSTAFATPAEAHAIRVSAAIAWPVQVLAFAIARIASRDQVMVAWGIGALIRFATLAVYGFVVMRALELPPVAALISLATFFFVTMLLEPLLLTK